MPTHTCTYRHEEAAQYRATSHDHLRILGFDVKIGSTALTIGAFVVFAVFPFWSATWTTGRVALPTAVRVLLVVAMVAAIALRYRAMRELGAFFSRTLNVRVGQRIVRTGPFRYLRHPGYAANMLLYFSAALAIGQNWVGLAITVVSFALIWSMRISREESMMLLVFKDEYAANASDTARIIPFVL